MASVNTHGGAFSTDAPGYYRVKASNTGCSIRLQFTPNELVQCPKIGLTQTANSVQNAVPLALRPEIATRSNTAAEGDEGRHIDRMGGRTNPMYGANNPPAGQTGLGDSTTAGNTHFGHRNQRANGTFDTDDAWLTDGPSLAWGAGQTGRQTFETTALCLGGTMQGTYLGSVTWGYDRDAAGTITLRALSVASMGVPTDQFMTSLGKWNSANVDVGGTATASQDLPDTAHRTTDPSTLTDLQLETKMRQLHGRLSAMTEADDPVTYRNIRFEIRGLGAEAVRRATRVTDSGHKLTVARGNTLNGLARQHLGRASLWVQIFALNAAALQHGDVLPDGMELKMPVPYAP